MIIKILEIYKKNKNWKRNKKLIIYKIEILILNIFIGN